uniref:UDP-glucose:glycoprotein glucosyltransferase n=1 Tax=Mucochytrium quahogii TaxID=96639 RepID=A0A7S2RIH0_9STRA
MASWCVLSFALVSLCGSRCNARGNGLQVGLESGWLSHRFAPLMEASEFVGEDGFWQFVDAVISSPEVEGIESRQDAADAAVAIASTSPGNEGALTTNVLKASIDMRAYVAAIEQQRQIGVALSGVVSEALGKEPSRAWVALWRRGTGDVVFCDNPSELVGEVDGIASRAKKGEKRDVCKGECSDRISDLLQIFESDHVHPLSSSHDSGIVVVLHGVLGMQDFSALHKVLSEKVKSSKNLVYLVRYMPLASDPLAERTSLLQGYGIELDIKNMEYITVDDSKDKQEEGEKKKKKDAVVVDTSKEVQGVLFDKVLEAFPDAKENLLSLHAEMYEEKERIERTSNEIEQIKVWDLTDLAMQATKRILSSTKPLERWQDISCNLPLRGNKLISIPVPATLKRQAEQAERKFQSKEAKIQVNGISVDMESESFNIFGVLHTIRKEATYQSQAKKVGLPASRASEMVQEMANRFDAEDDDDEVVNDDDEGAAADRVLKAAGQRLDLRDGAKGAVVFVNNIEKDSRYRSWSRSVQMLLRQSYQLIPVRKNMYTSIIVINPASEASRSAMATVLDFIQRGAPVRYGFVFVDAEKVGDSECGARCFVGLFLASIEANSRGVAQKFLESFADLKSTSLDAAVEAFVAVNHKASSKRSNEEYMELAKSTIESEKAQETYEKMRAYAKSKGLSAPCWSINGLVQPGISTMSSNLVQILMNEQQIMQYQVHFGRVDDSTDIFKYLLEASGAVKRFNPVVMKPTAESNFVAVLENPVLSKVKYFYSPAMGKVDVTIWLLADDSTFSSSDGLARVESLLKFAGKSPESCRLAIVPSNGNIRSSVWKDIIEGDTHALTLKVEEYASTAREMGDDLPSSLRSVGSHMGDLISTSSRETVFVNGRIIELADNVAMEPEDYEFLVEQEIKLRARHVKSVLGDEYNTLSIDTFMQASSVAGVIAKVPRETIDFGPLRSEFSELVYSSSEYAGEEYEDGSIRVTSIIDPLSPAAPRVVSVIKFLRDALDAHVEILFVPQVSVSKFPLPSFYRYVGYNDVESPHAVFNNMPQTQLLTLKISTPEPWIVYAANTNGLDTDNIRLGDESRDQTVTFSLKNILVTGHCQESGSGNPPAGLQLQLGSISHESTASDTLVMRNLGYWQLQASPGAWYLEIAPGRSRDLYKIKSISTLGEEVSPWFAAYHVDDGSSGPTKHEEGKVVVIRDFSGQVEQLVVKKRAGKESEELLSELEQSPTKKKGKKGASPSRKAGHAVQDEGFFARGLSWVKGIVFGPPEVDNTPSDGDAEAEDDSLDTIHVFTLASGALYERFMRIMMVSVVKRTNNPVKFWLIENFLSPDFKKTIPMLAKKYNFQYALVTYKWPHWLRRQTEKQRIIWGYKILFLDVLFPLNVPKVIYVDADQVVRADLRELWEMDLEGKPYGYTPFCTSRKETLGFQFWRQGYWKDHLGGKPYHISALYVVDLVKFRQMMVGDRLRATYDQLSRDPNSLSNLDQDLPNYAQNMVPIFSLPQEWLWCESWCSDESKASAKTIDLCNNPQHKEPKLDMAKRVIAGDLFPQSWVELDEEIKAVLRA